MRTGGAPPGSCVRARGGVTTTVSCDADQDSAPPELPARGPEVDLVERRTLSRERAHLGERRELGLDRSSEALLVVGLEGRERIDVGGQRVAGGDQLTDLRFEPGLLLVRDPTGRGLGLGDDLGARASEVVTI